MPHRDISSKVTPSEAEPYEVVIGLEAHVQLATTGKMFSTSSWTFGGAPNTQLDAASTGYPGALPVINEEAVDLALLLALALDCEITDPSCFARKSYFYPDLPKGYQITQHRHPLARGGRLPLGRHDRAVAIQRLHLEEDAGKMVHRPAESLVDLNRAGAPLAEIVTRAEIHTPDEAQDFFHSLHHLVQWLGVGSGAMEEGALRCDANVSLRPTGSAALGARVEVKNLNSFRQLGLALKHEIQRQRKLLAKGQEVVPETRGFDVGSDATFRQRGKEDSPDYRYFDDPDLPPLRLGQRRLARLQATLPELPWRQRERLRRQFHVDCDTARQLTRSRRLAEYFEATTASLLQLIGDREVPGGDEQAPAAAARWLLNETIATLRDRGEATTPDPTRLPPQALAATVALVVQGTLSSTGGQRLLVSLLDEPLEAQVKSAADGPSRQAPDPKRWFQAARRRVDQRHWGQIGDGEALDDWIRRAMDEFPQQLEAYRAGKVALLGFFIGRVMEISQQRANPRDLQKRLQIYLQKGFQKNQQREPSRVEDPRA